MSKQRQPVWQVRRLTDSLQCDERPSFIPVDRHREGGGGGTGGKAAVKRKNESLQATRQKAETDLDMKRAGGTRVVPSERILQLYSPHTKPNLQTISSIYG